MVPIPHLLAALLGPLSIGPLPPPEPIAGGGSVAPVEVAVEADAEAESEDLTNLSLEELMNMEVTIGSRSAEHLSSIPAAVYVLTGDEIRRSGFTNLQDALRMVPGFFVSRYDSSGWSVSARGFSGGFSNQLLVMVDGVSVYTPLFAGVWWQLQDLNMGDIDRVEIIRGPGATIWGANAVNGIVNVITKHTSETVGARTFASVGYDEETGTVRYGSQLPNGWLRVWVKGSDHNALPDANGAHYNDDWNILSTGFRADIQRENGDRLNFWGKAWSASIGEQYFIAFPDASYYFANDDTPKFGGILSGTWEHDDSPDSSMKLQTWYQRDHYKQIDWNSTIDILDVDFQRTRQLDTERSLVWGLGYRLVHSSLDGDFTLVSHPKTRDANTLRGYVQEQIAFPELKTHVTLGVSAEHNDFTGVEVQPSARVHWQPTEKQSVWLSAARAVRTPSLEEEDVTLNIPVAPNTFVAFAEGPDLRAEELYALETGYRYQHNENLAVDVTAFLDEYDHLMTLEDGNPYMKGPSLYFPIYIDNLAHAESFGLELAVDWDVTADWRLRSAYSAFYLHSNIEAASTDIYFSETDDSTPRNQANVRSYYDLTDAWEVDVGVYYVDNVGYFGTPMYTRVDGRLGYNPSPDWRFSIGVQNAFTKQHPEEGDDLTGFGSEVIRNAYFNLAWSH